MGTEVADTGASKKKKEIDKQTVILQEKNVANVGLVSMLDRESLGPEGLSSGEQSVLDRARTKLGIGSAKLAELGAQRTALEKNSKSEK